MQVIIAEDDEVTLRRLSTALTQWGHEVAEARDGDEAWLVLCSTTGPRLAVLDWMMPGASGPELCRRIRASGSDAFEYLYIILLTAKDRKDDIVAGLDAGADDYVTKPFDYQELRARVGVGKRVVELQHHLAGRNRLLADTVRRLEDCLATIRRLHGLLPICAYCKRIRDDQDYWHQIEAYISEHSETEFTHGICPDCYRQHVAPQLEPADPA
jgi:sigma-B regulation protein RsbU (phosphoserine phosphatase)